MLQCNGDGAGEAIHQATDGGSLFGHGDENFSGASVRIETDGDVALVSAHIEFVSDRSTLFLQLVANSARRPIQTRFIS